MSRPSSRGGMAVPPSTLQQGVGGPGARPGTMSRGMLSSRGGVPPGTAARLRTGAMPTTAGTQAGYGVALTTDVQVADRPVTQQGMRGMKTGVMGPGRQVADQSYYIGILRNRVNEITAEVRKLKGEQDQHNRDTSQYSQYERRYETLLKEVRNLEGTLADYNLAMDKVRTSTDPDEVRQYQKQVEAKNKREAQEIDRIFLMKQQREKEIADIETQIAALQRQAEEKINSLEPRKLQLYKELLARSKALQGESMEVQSRIEASVARIRELSENSMGGQSFNDEYSVLEKRVDRLNREKKELDDDMQIAQMDPKEAHAKLLAKVKEDNKRLADLELRCREFKEEITRMRKHLTDLATDMAERKGDNSNDSQKYEVLYKRDQEMTEFIEKFEETRMAVIQDQQKVQETVVALLEHISQGLEVESTLPSQQRFTEIKDEVSFKEKQLESSQMTMQRLIDEKNRRVQELEKISNLDEKIVVELMSISNKIESMQKEMVEFDDIDHLRSRAEATQTYLSEARRNYIKRRDSIKQQVQLLSTLYENKKKQLATNDTATVLESLEQKLKHYEQNIFAMKDYIEGKLRETDFQGARDECMRLVQQLNQMHKQMDETNMKMMDSVY